MCMKSRYQESFLLEGRREMFLFFRKVLPISRPAWAQIDQQTKSDVWGWFDDALYAGRAGQTILMETMRISRLKCFKALLFGRDVSRIISAPPQPTPRNSDGSTPFPYSFDNYARKFSTL